MPERNCSYAPDARQGEIQTPLLLYLLRVFSVPVVLVATNETVSKLSRKVLSTFATDDGGENADVKNLAMELLLFPPPPGGPTRRLHRFGEEEDDDEGEEEAVQQKHVVLVNVALLLVLLMWSRSIG